MTDEVEDRGAETYPELPQAQSLTAREACMRDIKHHLDTVGSIEWAPVMARHPEILSRTFWRIVAQVRRGNGRITPDARYLKGAIATITKHAQSAAIRAHIPQAPPPSIVAAGGVEARRKLDFMTHLDEMLLDCKKLRGFAVRVEEDGTEKVINPMYFQQSIKLRNEIINTGLSAMKALWNLEKMQELYDTIIAEVSNVDPETGLIILQKLRELDDARGMTLNARV